MLKRAQCSRTVSLIISIIFVFSTFFSAFGSLPNKTFAATPVFNHPGILQTQADLDRMKKNVALGLEPWTSEFHKLQDNPLASKNFTTTFTSTVCRQGGEPTTCPDGQIGNTELLTSASAAYLNAIEWYITGNQEYADEAISILNGWSNVLTSVAGADAILASSLYGYKLLNAAEIIRYSNAGWLPNDISKFSSMMTNVFYPIVKNYGFTKGKWANGNWDAACIVFNMSYGVWNDDKSIFDDAVNYYKAGAGNGSITHYIQTMDGQTQESGRDQAHVQMGIGLLAEAAEIGLNQTSSDFNGADMVSYPNNSYLLLKGFEYTSKYNLGYQVSYVALPDANGTFPYKSLSSTNRGEFRPIYEQAYNLFHNKAGLPDTEMPFTKRVINTVKMENFHSDEPSYGGLLNAENQRTGPQTPNVAIVSKNARDKVITAANVGQSPLIDNVELYKADGSYNIATQEKFAMEYLGNSTYAFKALINNNYVSENNGGSAYLVADNPTIGNPQKYVVSQDVNSYYYLNSVTNNLYENLDTTNQIAATASDNTATTAAYILLYQETPVTDTLAPGTPLNLTAAADTSTYNNINLNWSASTDDTGVIGYYVYRNGVKIGTAYGTSYSDTGLPELTTYSYTVQAFDESGNTSAHSNQAAATTNLAPLQPSDDATVTAGTSANTNLGTSSKLTVKLNTPDTTRESYLKFDLSKYNMHQVVSAKVRLYVTSVGTNVGVTEANYVPNDSWSENAITWNTKPTASTNLAVWNKPAAGSYVEFDVTNQLNKELANELDKKLSLRIETTSLGDGVDFGSKEQTNIAYRPMLMVKEDMTPPVTSDDAPRDWANKDVTFNLNSSDNGGSGVASTYYKINNGSTQTGNSITFSDEGVHTVTYWSVDNAGNTEAPHSTTVKIDKTVPITTLATNPSTPNGENDWYTSDVQVSISASDSGGSGVSSSEYRINGGEWITYNGSINLTNDGIYTIDYRSRDNAGNVEAYNTKTIKLDKSAPALNIRLDQTELWAPNNQLENVNATVNANDSLSGISKTELVSITSNEPDSGLGDIQNASYGVLDISFDLRVERSGKNISGRVYTIKYKVTDVAGNVTTQSVNVAVSHDQR
jgi:hypothetical protein